MPPDSDVRQMNTSTSYAGLGWRFAAVVIDSLVVGGLFVVILVIAAAAGALALTAYQGQDPWNADVPAWSYMSLYLLLFVYYTLFELRRGATPGKMAFGMRVTAMDGTPPQPGAIVVRNLIRVPEAILYYLPAAIAVLVSSKRQRLGDLVARTVVVRRGPVPVSAQAGPVMQSPVGQSPVAPVMREAVVHQAPEDDGVDETLDALKSAALGLRGAHHNYLRLAEREIDRGGGVTEEFSPEYSAAWHTLADAVMTLQHANQRAARAAEAAGTTLPEVSARRPDLLNLAEELEPYFSAASDEQVQEAYLTVARRERRPL